MTTKKIAFYIDSLKLGGAERVTLQWAQWCVAAGWSVSIITRQSIAQDVYKLPVGVNRLVETKPSLTWKILGWFAFPLRLLRLRKLLNMSVNEIELSVRAANCLNNANITTVGELAMKSEQEMLKYRNFGKKSLNEIKDKLEQLGLSLGMKIDERLLDNPIEL